MIGLILNVVILGFIIHQWDVNVWVAGGIWCIIVLITDLFRHKGNSLISNMLRNNGYWGQAILFMLAVAMGAAWLGYWLGYWLV